MSFVRLNGFPVRCTRFEEKPIEIGSRSRAIDGTPLVDRQTIKRSWVGETRPLMRWEATAVRALLRGQGHVWPFDSDDYSSKGLAPESGAVRTLRGAAADGDPVEDEYQFTGAVAVEDAATNLLDADSRDAENAPTGYTAINGATLAADTDNYWQGSQSLKVSTDAVGSDIEGARTATINPTNATYYGSVYLKGDAGGEQVTVYLYDIDNTTSGTPIAVTLAADEWTRVACDITVSGSSNLALYVVETNADSDIDFYCDGFQIELPAGSPSYDIHTSWVDGSRAAGELNFDPSVVSGYRDITINLWARMGTWNSTGGAGTNRFLFYMREIGGSALYLYRLNAANDLRFYTTDADGGNADTITDTSTWDDDWHMITAVIRNDPATGVATKELYVDGASVGSSSPGGLPEFDSLERLSIANAYGVQFAADSLVDDVAFAPFAADDALVATWYAIGKAMLATGARVYVDGDAIREAEFTVEAVGNVVSSKFVAAHNTDGDWDNAMEVIRFTLEEA